MSQDTATDETGPPVERALVVAAHPDDIDFGAAGTVATWVESGIDVRYCIVTDGDAGGFDLTVPRAEMATIRQDEQRAAAAAVGVTDVTFLGYPDGRLVVSIDLRRDISRVIRQVRPQRVLSPSPDRALDRLFASHPDHLAAGEATLCAVYPDSRNPFAHPELLEAGFEPHVVAETWLMAGGTEPSVFVDVTDLFDRKWDALRCHRSQLSDPAETRTRVRGWMAATARAGGLAEGRLAEAFRVVQTA